MKQEIWILPVQSGPGGLQDQNLNVDFNFSSLMLITSKKMHILLYKLTSYSSNKKLVFLPVQSELEACSTWTWRPILIFSAGISIISIKMHILFNNLISNSSNKNFKFFYLSRNHLPACSTWTWRPIQKMIKYTWSTTQK